MSTLSEKLRKAREVKVEAGGFVFTVRRPTDLEMIYLRDERFGRAVLPFVIDWEGVSELSMFDGGTPHPLPFDSAACQEWIEDRLDLLGLIVQAVVDAYEAHAEKIAQAVKN